ncbi:MAG: hypothetical protein IJS28_11995 [Synergistaceae bacterium]|nr:hypothetical protein [Synergistaceae bacterium]
MKRILALFAALAVIFTSASAFGFVQKFARFSVDVPEGWTANQDGDTVILIKTDNTASMSITVGDPQGMNKKALAEAFVKELNGKNLERDDDGDYTFTMTNANGVESLALLTGDDDDYALFVMTGLENAKDEMMAILGSVKDN